MSNPIISVIIPIYGTEKYLDKCLNSVRNQTLKDIEIICVDDCSPDDSYLIVERHAAVDSRISLIRHDKNLGLGGARNTAINVAKSDYVASVDSDDYIEPTMMNELWEATDNGSIDIVCCGFNRIDEDDSILSYQEFPESLIINNNNDIDIFSTFNPAFWNKLWRKSLYVDNNIYFPNYDYFEDMSTTPRILAKAKRIKCIKGRLYQYLIRSESITGKSSEKHLVDYFKGFELIIRFLEANNLADRYMLEFKRYIKRHILYYAKTNLGAEDLVHNKEQYLRLLILFRISFDENFKKFKEFDLGDSLTALGNDDLHGKYYELYENSLKKIEIKEDYISQQSDEIVSKKQQIADHTDTIQQLRAEFHLTQSNLNNANKKLVIEKEKLKSKFSKEVSLSQMLAILVFGILFKPTMSHKQTLKLINKPKAFFHDSNNILAKKFASWIKIL